MKDLRDRFDVLATGAEHVTTELKDASTILRGFADDLRSLQSAMSETERAFSSAELGAAPKTQTAAPGVDTGGLDQVGNHFAMVGSRISTVLHAAFRPLQQASGQAASTLERIADMVDKVSGTFITLAQRIDSTMKFRGQMRRIDTLKSKIESITGAVTRTFDGFRTTMDHKVTASSTRAGRALWGLAGAVTAGVGGSLKVMGNVASGSLSKFQGFKKFNFWFSALGDVASKTFSDIEGKGGNAFMRVARAAFTVKPQQSIAGLGLLGGALLKIGPYAISAAKGLLGIGSWALKMAGIQPWRLLMLFVNPLGLIKLGAKGAAQGLGSIGKAAKGATGTVRNFGRELMVALGVFGLAYKAVQFFKDGVKGASNLNETINKTQSILGDAYPAAEKFASGLSSQFGLVKGDVLDAEAAFGGLGKGLGKLSGDKLSQFSNQFTQLAADMSSWANMDMSTATNALQTALSGNQSDELKKLGVVLLDDAVKARAVAAGFATSAKNVSESAKVQARALMIAEQLADANGDLAKTANSPANMYRKLTGSLQNLAAQAGQALMPILTKLGNALVSGLQQASSLWESNKEAILGFQQGAFLAFESLKEAFSGLFQMGGDFPSVMDTAFGENSWGMVKAFASNIVSNVGTAVEGIGSFLRNIPEYFHIGLIQAAKWIDVLTASMGSFAEWARNNWSKMLLDGIQLISRAFLDLSSLMGRLGGALSAFLADPMKGFHFDPTPFLNGFKSTMEKLPDLAKPDLTALNNEIADTWKKIEAKDKKIRDQVKADVLAANEESVPNHGKPPKPAPDEAAAGDKKKGRHVEKAGAIELGSKEAYSAIVKFKSGQQDQLLVEARKQTELLKTIAAQRKAAKDKINENAAVLNMA